MSFALKSVHGARFRDRVARIRAAFRAARAPFYEEIERVENEAVAFQLRVDAGTAQWAEFDDETGAGWDHGEEFGERQSDAEDALLTVRKAFVMMTYHLWERGAQRWATQANKKPNHGHLVAALISNSIAVDATGLSQLNLLVNCLKHNSTSCGPDLYKARPDLFAGDFDPNEIHPATGKPFKNIDWAENIVLTDANIEAFLVTVTASAPK